VIGKHYFSGRGAFGEVFLARAKGIHEGEDKEKETVVMVKSLQNTREDSALQEFKRELDMFHKLHHQHVARLLGLCREADPHYLILEYSDWVYAPTVTTLHRGIDSVIDKTKEQHKLNYVIEKYNKQHNI
jgi:serine/threonine protein kinase